MVERSGLGNRLWIEAAGPELVVGLLGGDGRDLVVRSGRPVLEALAPLLEELRVASGETGLAPDGLVVGAGPGSSLGLRVAAMTARTLLRSPALRGGDCRQYNLLEVAAVYLLRKYEKKDRATALAPFRRDCLHRVTVHRETGRFRFERDAVASAEEVDGIKALFAMGNREAVGRGVPVYGADELVAATPGLLRAYPELLWEVREPEPLQLAGAAYARWAGRRHGA